MLGLSAATALGWVRRAGRTAPLGGGPERGISKRQLSSSRPRFANLLARVRSQISSTERFDVLVGVLTPVGIFFLHFDPAIPSSRNDLPHSSLGLLLTGSKTQLQCPSSRTPSSAGA